MPGKHDPSKKFISISLSRELFYRLTQYSESIGVKRNTLVTKMIKDYVKVNNIQLSKHYEDLAAEETEAIRKSRQETWSPVVKKTGKKGGK